MPDKEQMWFTYGDDKNLQKALDLQSEYIQEHDIISQRTRANINRDFRGIKTNTDIRSPFTRRNYEAFNPEDAIPTNPKDIILACNDIYRQCGLVRNVVDLMADFASQGVRLVHNSKPIEKFYKRWFKQVRGPERSERFLNNLYRCGVVPIRRITAKILRNNAEKYFKSNAAADLRNPKPIKNAKNEIPWKYNFLNPSRLEILGSELDVIQGNLRYALEFPLTVDVNKIKNQSADSKIPLSELKNMDNKRRVILPEDKFIIFHYKKDDWKKWADPMTFAILSDVLRLKKMELADLASLHGATGKIRVWKLGDLENKIFPTNAAINKLSDLLLNNSGGGAIDLVWGPVIDLLETNTDVHQFLGSEKYIQTIAAIHAGLGIPPSLTGMSLGGGSSTFTNNSMSLKTIIERLEYGRNLLIEFWEHEIKLVQEAYGFREPAKIVFDHMILTDEAAEKKLFLDLADRTYVSHERLLERFGEQPDIEFGRIEREENNRREGRMVDKAGPFYNGEKPHDLRKIALQTGQATPSEVGLELDEKEDGQERVMDAQKNGGLENTPKNPQSGGRPNNSRDKNPRKQRQPQPSTKGMVKLVMWTEKAQEKIAEYINPYILKAYGKRNFRELSKTQSLAAELQKFSLLASLEPFSPLSKNKILKGNLYLSDDFKQIYGQIKKEFIDKYEREPGLNELRDLFTESFVLYHS